MYTSITLYYKKDEYQTSNGVLHKNFILTIKLLEGIMVHKVMQATTMNLQNACNYTFQLFTYVPHLFPNQINVKYSAA